MSYFDIYKSVLIIVFIFLIEFAMLVFIGFSIDVVGATTFFKLVSRVAKQIPMLSDI
ncbi:hypothetical protein [Candidatus Villigracilis vicinus]|uniref:hypothetical protein n=1 Tax=Candidatus Villigracilis vicinus TaxID=3140679 RepID=UPI0031EDA859